MTGAHRLEKAFLEGVRASADIDQLYKNYLRQLEDHKIAVAYTSGAVLFHDLPSLSIEKSLAGGGTEGDKTRKGYGDTDTKTNKGKSLTSAKAHGSDNQQQKKPGGRLLAWDSGSIALVGTGVSTTVQVWAPQASSRTQPTGLGGDGFDSKRRKGGKAGARATAELGPAAVRGGKTVSSINAWKAGAPAVRFQLPEAIECVTVTAIDDGNANAGSNNNALGHGRGFIVAGTRSGKIAVWSCPGGELLRSQSAHFRPVRSVAVCSALGIVATGGDDAAIHFWRLVDLTDTSVPPTTAVSPIASALEHTLPITGLAFTSTSGCGSGRVTLYSVSSDRSLRVWQYPGSTDSSTTRGMSNMPTMDDDATAVANLTSDHNVLLKEAPTCLSLDAMTTMAAVGTLHGSLLLVELVPRVGLADLAQNRDRDHDQREESDDEDEEAKRKIGQHQEVELDLSSLLRWRRIREAHEGKINVLRFLSNGRQLLTGGEDNAVHLWDISSGQRLRSSKPLAGSGVTDFLMPLPIAEVASSANYKPMMLQRHATVLTGEDGKVTAKGPIKILPGPPGLRETNDVVPGGIKRWFTSRLHWWEPGGMTQGRSLEEVDGEDVDVEDINDALNHRRESLCRAYGSRLDEEFGGSEVAQLRAELAESKRNAQRWKSAAEDLYILAKESLPPAKRKKT
eukprot:Clim_evm135s149 gene=Clim_evmTU135s149